MDLLRFEDKDVGPVYLDGRLFFTLLSDPNAPTMTKLLAYAPHGVVANLDLVGDADEIALVIERSVPGARVHRIT
jgi:hypothetical protein